MATPYIDLRVPMDMVWDDAGTPRIVSAANPLPTTAAGGSTMVQGTVADGAAAGAQKPVVIAGVDGAGNVQTILTDTAGLIQVSLNGVTITAMELNVRVNEATDSILFYGFDGAVNRKVLTDTAGDLMVNIDKVGGTAASPFVTGSDDSANSTTKLPVISARANAAAPTWTEGRQVPLSCDLAGALRVAGTVQPGNTANTTPWLVSTKTALTASAPLTNSVDVASAEVVPTNAARKGLILVNTSANTISLGFSGNTAVINQGVTLNPGGTYNMGEHDFTTGQVNAVASGAASNLTEQEYT